jgi:hypothetical protein
LKNELQEAKRALGFEQNRVKVAERERDKAERELREAKGKKSNEHTARISLGNGNGSLNSRQQRPTLFKI